MSNMRISGVVTWANNSPASGVSVRVFDQDAPGRNDDDLTTIPGISGANGNFTVEFDPGRFRDTIDQVMRTWQPRNPPWDYTPVEVDWNVSVPDLTDAYVPYLQFSYTLGGQSRTATKLLIPLNSRYALPDTPIPSRLDPFQPSQHGFKFVNDWPGYPLPYNIPQLPQINEVDQGYGLCGGMSAAAADFYLGNRPIPSTATVPAQGSPLQQYIHRRQIDTFGPAGAYIVKFADWMALPDGTLIGTQRRTHDEFDQLRARLDAGELVVLGLVYLRVPDPIWGGNHQVLAYGYSQPSATEVNISVYDPNYPGDDGVVIRAQRVIAGITVDSRFPPRIVTVFGLQCTRHAPSAVIGQGDLVDEPLRGFFVMQCQRVTPPIGL